MPTEPDVIEGEAVDVTALTVMEPERLSVERTPEGTIDLATRMATALKDIVEKQKLYAVIQGKKYPQVEAWMTIARMDNVVAREASNPIRHDDGWYEATVELIRLSDGMVVGQGSAICGTPGDKPWDARPEPARRSMAVTRATSRAFRQQYSWIMALAGYEPTPADEMPPERSAPDRPEMVRRAEGLIGTVEVGKPPVDLDLRPTPDGPAWGFKLKAQAKGYQCLAIGQLATALATAHEAGSIVGQRVQVYGDIEMVGWEKDGKQMPPYPRIRIERLATPDWVLPADSEPVVASGDVSDEWSADEIAEALS